MTQLILRECEDCGGMLAFAFDGETALFLRDSESALNWLGLGPCKCGMSPQQVAALEAEIEEEERADGG